MHGFTTLDLVVVLVYLGGIAALGMRQVVHVKGSGDYFAGGRKFSKWLMMMHALGTGTHADDPVGVVGAAYQRGLSGIWYTYVYLFCTPFYWIIAPLFRRSRYLTTADFFESRFGRNLGLLYSVMGVVIFSVNTGTMLKGTGTVAASVTEGAMPEWLAIVLMTAVFVAYGMAGGLIATVVAESIQGVLIVVMSLLLVPFGLAAVGGFQGLHEAVPAVKFNLAAPQELTLPWIVAASLAMLIGIVAQPHIMEVCASGKTEWEGRVGFTYGNFVKRFCAMGWVLTGVIVTAMVAKGLLAGPLAHREDAFGVAIRELLPPGMTGLMFAAILAAQMSTLSAFMVAGSALLARNVYQRCLGPWLWARRARRDGEKSVALTDAPEVPDKQVLWIGRWAGLLVVALGVGFAFMVQGVAEALTFFWALNSFLGVSIWFAVLWRRTNATGVWLSFAAMALIWLPLGPLGAKVAAALPQCPWLGLFGDKKMLDLLLLSYLPAGTAALVLGSLFSRPERPSASAWVTLGAVGGIAAGLSVQSLAPGVTGPWGGVLHALPLAARLTLLSALGAALLGWVFRGPVDEALLDRFYRLIHTPVGRENELVEHGVDVVYTGASTGHPWELNHPHLVNIGGFAAGLAFAFAILGMLQALAHWGA